MAGRGDETGAAATEPASVRHQALRGSAMVRCHQSASNIYKPMSDPDTRWKQRLSNFNRALSQLVQADELSRQRQLSPLEKQGLIQAFEFTYDLGWNTLKDYLTFQGIADLVGSRDTTREAFRHNLIADGDGWMMMLSDRNRTSHTYNEATAEDIVAHIHARYVELFRALASTLQARAGDP